MSRGLPRAPSAFLFFIRPIFLLRNESPPPSISAAAAAAAFAAHYFAMFASSNAKKVSSAKPKEERRSRRRHTNPAFPSAPNFVLGRSRPASGGGGPKGRLFVACAV